MSQLLSGTNVPNKEKGDKLYYTEINSINNTINNSVDVLNNYLRSFCNVNLDELKDPEIQLTLEEAILKVGISRRCPGMIIRFNSSETDQWESYEYFGNSVINEDWENINNWILSDLLVELDGGVF